MLYFIVPIFLANGVEDVGAAAAERIRVISFRWKKVPEEFIHMRTNVDEKNRHSGLQNCIEQPTCRSKEAIL